jgi:hypothetical protein
MKEVLKEEGLLTENDPGMVICTPELNDVLGPNAFHIKQLGIYCFPHLILLREGEQMRLREKYRGVVQHLAEDAGERAMEILDIVLFVWILRQPEAVQAIRKCSPDD